MGQWGSLQMSSKDDAKPQPEQLLSLDRAPALRISHFVRGRKGEGNRVTYLVDPDGRGQERAISETVVLKRWRQRAMPDYVFSGTRLKPSVWRALAFLLPELASDPMVPTALEIHERKTAQAETLRRKNLYMPSADVARALALDLGPKRLSQLMVRHKVELKPGTSGVPDLYLYAMRVDQPHDKPAFSRFVEVKRPKERVSAAQLQEIDLLRALGLQARILRLIERL
jgi:hypothetical protein